MLDKSHMTSGSVSTLTGDFFFATKIHHPKQYWYPHTPFLLLLFFFRYTSVLAKNSMVEFYHRLLPGSGGLLMEGVLVGRSTSSWVAVGWRPSSAEQSCQGEPEGVEAAPRPTGADRRRGLSAMDCADFVVAQLRGGDVLRIGDFYSRDRWEEEEEWGGGWQ